MVPSLLRGRVLEIPAVDCLQARLLDREAQKSAARGDDSSSRVWPHVTFGQKPHTVFARSLDGSHARHSSQPLGKALSFRLHFDVETAAQDLPAELRHRADKHDTAFVEQRDSVANALHVLKHMGRQ